MLLLACLKPNALNADFSCSTSSWPLSFSSTQPKLWGIQLETESLFSEDSGKVGEILSLLAGVAVTEGSLTHSIIHSNEYSLNV